MLTTRKKWRPARSSLKEDFWFLLSFSAFFWPLGWPFWGNVLLALFIGWFGTLDDGRP